MKEIPLGKTSEYPSQYSPDLLFAIARADNRNALGLKAGQLPFRGYDLWRAYEISCLDSKGKPMVATAEFIVPANSPFIIESKSLKLYLNSLNQTPFADLEQLQSTIAADLTKTAASPVIVHLYQLHKPEGFAISRPDGICLDTLDIDVQSYTPDSSLLRCASAPVSYTHLTLPTSDLV